ncbi:RIP metalloprotease RseP [Acetonema longum]|uniref:Zinc metalloprotease n=1 Tax=Acetonema longum DSM 6540 TaxID=1009370 RepID=F7NL84_9FIRM|nr:RIP metalloprotease RseP [Acetonema longum]EGO63189.1 membrane-associated zinc metalloprotease [Acetonema longum DSM 6540]
MIPIATIFAAIFVFGLLVIMHELGHFAAAKLVGMGVHEFAIGFGPKLLSRKVKNTVYSLRLIPLGGFNKIAGMDPDEPQDQDSFNSKPIWARILVIIAGSAMNFLLPVILFAMIFWSAGIDLPSEEPVLGTVMSDKPASQAGLLTGDRIVSIDGVRIGNWMQMVEFIQKNPGKSLKIAYSRHDQPQEVTITPEYDEQARRGIIGVLPQIFHQQPGFVESIKLACRQTYQIGMGMIIGIGQMITGQIPADVAGPIGVAQMAGQVAQLGFIPLLQFTALLSINLGLINMLPVPVLDGGHVVTLLVEAVRRKPLEKNQLYFIQMIGFALLMALLLMATFKDIARSIGLN